MTDCSDIFIVGDLEPSRPNPWPCYDLLNVDCSSYLPSAIATVVIAAPAVVVIIEASAVVSVLGPSFHQYILFWSYKGWCCLFVAGMGWRYWSPSHVLPSSWQWPALACSTSPLRNWTMVKLSRAEQGRTGYSREAGMFPVGAISSSSSKVCHGPFLLWNFEFSCCRGFPGWSNSFLFWHPAIVLVTTFNVKLWPDTKQQARDSHWKQVCPRLLLCTFIFISTTSAPTRVAKGRVRGRRVTQVIVGGGTRATKGSHDMFTIDSVSFVLLIHYDYSYPLSRGWC